MARLIKLIVLSIALCSSCLQAAEREKVGLVLSGGGARGIALIGVLKELERQRVPIDFITGTSMGSIVGALYASGRSVEEIEQIVQRIDWDDVFSDKPSRQDATLRRKFDKDTFQMDKELGIKDGKIQFPSGLLRGQKLQLLLDRLFIHVSDIENFDDFPIPFRAVATDIATGEAVVLSRGSLGTAVRASMSVPSVFTTVKHQNRTLVDGGISNNLPVDVAREMGADAIIAVDISSSLLEEEQLNSVLSVSLQLTTLMVRNTTQAQIKTLTSDDILIVPDLNEFSSADFEHAVETIDVGAQATALSAPQLARLALHPDEFELLVEDEQVIAPSIVISAIDINNDSNYSEEFIRAKISQQVDTAVNFDQLEQDIDQVYGLGSFESITYDIISRDEGNRLILNLTQKTWGPRYLQFGLRYSGELSSNSQLTGVVGLTTTPLNDLNGEWRNLIRFGAEPGLLTQYHQPLGINSPFFFNSNLSYIIEKINTFEDGVKINQTKSKTLSAILTFGKEFGNWGDIRFGIDRSRSANSAEFGIPEESVGSFDGGEIFTLGRIDTLDNIYFPKKGIRGSFRLSQSSSKFGSDFEFEQLRIDAIHASTWGAREHTLIVGARYFSTIEGTAPIQDNFRLGGLFDLPGFNTNELSGEHLYLLRSAYQKRLDDFFGFSPYLGLTLQYGNVFENEDDISLSDGIIAAAGWFGWDTAVGPIYVGYGQAETGDGNLYFSIGGFF